MIPVFFRSQELLKQRRLGWDTRAPTRRPGHRITGYTWLQRSALTRLSSARASRFPTLGPQAQAHVWVWQPPATARMERPSRDAAPARPPSSHFYVPFWRLHACTPLSRRKEKGYALAWHAFSSPPAIKAQPRRVREPPTRVGKGWARNASPRQLQSAAALAVMHGGPATHRAGSPHTIPLIPQGFAFSRTGGSFCSWTRVTALTAWPGPLPLPSPGPAWGPARGC